MWMGEGCQNQWPEAAFHKGLLEAVEKDRKTLPASLTEAEIMSSCFMLVLWAADVAGHG